MGVGDDFLCHIVHDVHTYNVLEVCNLISSLSLPGLEPKFQVEQLFIGLKSAGQLVVEAVAHNKCLLVLIVVAFANRSAVVLKIMWVGIYTVLAPGNVAVDIHIAEHFLEIILEYEILLTVLDLEWHLFNWVSIYIYSNLCCIRPIVVCLRCSSIDCSFEVYLNLLAFGWIVHTASLIGRWAII